MTIDTNKVPQGTYLKISVEVPNYYILNGKQNHLSLCITLKYHIFLGNQYNAVKEQNDGKRELLTK